jgi:hypothetical protein
MPSGKTALRIPYFSAGFMSSTVLLGQKSTNTYNIAWRKSGKAITVNLKTGKR